MYLNTADFSKALAHGQMLSQIRILYPQYLYQSYSCFWHVESVNEKHGRTPCLLSIGVQACKIYFFWINKEAQKIWSLVFLGTKDRANHSQKTFSNPLKVQKWQWVFAVHYSQLYDLLELFTSSLQRSKNEEKTESICLIMFSWTTKFRWTG